MTLTSRRFPWLGWKSVDAGRMMFPMIMYWMTGKREWFKATMMPMAITEDNITEDIYETAKLSIDHTKVKTTMPTNVSAARMAKCKAPTLVMAAEKDCLFPGPGTYAFPYG